MCRSKLHENTPSIMNTFLLIRRLAEHVSYGAIASRFCKNIRTAEAWGREPESNSNPMGTGKKNPIDAVLRLMAMAHEKDKGLAKEIADLFPEYYEFLSGETSEKQETVSFLVGQAVKEHADAVTQLLSTETPDIGDVDREMTEFEIAWTNLKNYWKEEKFRGRRMRAI